jgi:CRISPR-associated protein Cst1
LYVGKQVPKIITEVLKDDEAFRTIGYAFVSGLISGSDNNRNDNNKN